MICWFNNCNATHVKTVIDLTLLFTATITGNNKSPQNNSYLKKISLKAFSSALYITFCVCISLLKLKTRTKMENYSFTPNHTTTELPFIHCPPLPDLIQWRKDYLTPTAFYNSIATVIVNAMLFFVSVTSNSLLIIAILVNRDLRRTHFMMILLSLSTTGKIHCVDKYYTTFGI